MKCPNCPVDAELVCPGVDVLRFCQLIDPNHRDHQPAYRGTVMALAASTAAGPFEPAALADMADDTEPCCGGTGAMPGVFDGL
jgi:hypothetical protein